MLSISVGLIEKWLHEKCEDENLEFKEAKTSYDREKLYKYCVALANERGGYLVLGISDKVPRTVVGTAAFEKLGEIKSQIRIHTHLHVEVGEYEYDGARIVVFKIPSRPAGTAYSYKGAYFARSGEELVTMSEDRLRSIFSEGKMEWSQETLRAGLTAQEVIELLDVKTFFEFMDFPPSDIDIEIMDKLCNAGLAHLNGGKYSINRLAGIVLARDLNSFSELSRKAPRLIVYNGKDKLDTAHDIVGRRGYAAGIQGLMRLCMQHMPQNEVVQDALRQIVPLFPERAMREVVANALIHQDFEETGSGPIVEIYSNRIEVSNPGVPVVPVNRFIDSHKSRNEKLASVMRQLKICEERSSGVDRVVGTAEVFQLPAPEFIAAYDSTLVVVHGHRDFKDMTQDDKVRACYQHCVLKYVVREQMTNDSLRNRFGLADSSNTAVSKIIRYTLDAGLIDVDPTAGASRKYARYVPAWSVQH